MLIIGCSCPYRSSGCPAHCLVARGQAQGSAPCPDPHPGATQLKFGHWRCGMRMESFKFIHFKTVNVWDNHRARGGPSMVQVIFCFLPHSLFIMTPVLLQEGRCHSPPFPNLITALLWNVKTSMQRDPLKYWGGSKKEINSSGWVAIPFWDRWFPILGFQQNWRRTWRSCQLTDYLKIHFEDTKLCWFGETELWENSAVEWCCSPFPSTCLDD